jgi:glycosyltransferase involved in cell wall biosynthesis
VLVVSEPMEYGVLTHLERLFAGLDRSRWEPALAFSPHRMSAQAHRLVARLVADGIRIRRLPFRRRIGLGDAAAVAHLLHEVDVFRPDVLHLHSTKAGVVGRLAGRVRGIPVLYTPHGTSWRYTGRVTGSVQLALERMLRSATTLLVSVCREEASAFVVDVGFHPASIRLVPNGVAVPETNDLVEARGRARAALGIAPDAVWAVFVGRLTHEKGLDVLLDALAAGTGLDGLLVVGEGADRSALEAEAIRAGVRVRFCGYHEDVSAFLAAADVFVQPSRSEGLPFSVLEAMAHALPIAGSAVGGMSTAVDGCGRLVPPGRPDALAACLRPLARDGGLRRELGREARSRIAREFGIPAMIDALERAYEEATCRA